jgi:hypothetical protein
MSPFRLGKTIGLRALWSVKRAEVEVCKVRIRASGFCAILDLLLSLV